MPKQTAVDNFLKDIYTITKTQALDISIVNKDVVNKLLTKNGLAIDDIKKYIVTETGSNIYFDKVFLTSKFKENTSDFLDTVIGTAKSRLPNTIKSVVEKVPIIITKNKKPAVYDVLKNEILLSSNYIETTAHDPDANITNLLHSIGHEYWHAFSHTTNFKDNLKGMIKDKTTTILNQKVDSLNELAVHLNFIEELTEGHILDLVQKEYVDRWGTTYIKSEAVSSLENNLYKHIDKALIRGSFDEMMADSLGNIVAGTTHKVTNRGVNFILQRLAHKEKVEKINSLIESVNINEPHSIETSVAALLHIMENCDDCGL